MTDLTSLRWRLVRAATLAVPSGLIALAGHLVGGGESPDLASLLLITTILGGVTSGFAGKQRSFTGILAVMAVAQVFFHLTFLATSHTAHTGHSGLAVPLDAGRMLLFHALAALVAAIVVAHGEQALFGLVKALHRIVTRVLGPAPVHVGPAWSATFVRQHRANTGAELPTGLFRRGPPLPLGA